MLASREPIAAISAGSRAEFEQEPGSAAVKAWRVPRRGEKAYRSLASGRIVPTRPAHEWHRYPPVSGHAATYGTHQAREVAVLPSAMDRAQARQHREIASSVIPQQRRGAELKHRAKTRVPWTPPTLTPSVPHGLPASHDPITWKRIVPVRINVLRPISVQHPSLNTAPDQGGFRIKATPPPHARLHSEVVPESDVVRTP